jgi:hypothetical protein
MNRKLRDKEGKKKYHSFVELAVLRALARGKKDK